LKELDELIEEIEEYLKLMDSQRQTISDAISSNFRNNITTEQLESALKSIRHPPNEDRIKNIVKRLDKDGDGKIFLQEILELGRSKNQ
jgi:LETM1 and EF-hand domain-containing protein 1